MPTDDLFDSPPPNNDQTPGDQSQDSKDPAASAASPKLAEHLAKLSEGFTTLAGEIRQTNSRVDRLAQSVAPKADPADDTDPSVGADGKPLSPQAKKFSKFYDDPEGFIRAEAEKLVQTRLGPHLTTQARQRAAELETEQKQRIDNQFGAGTWDALYAKDFNQILSLPNGEPALELRASRDHVEAAVAAVHGRKTLAEDTRADLDARRAAVVKAKAEANQTPAMLPNGRSLPRAGTGTTLSAEEQEFLSTLNRNGIPYTREQYLAAREKGSKASAWAKAPNKGTNNGKAA